MKQYLIIRTKGQSKRLTQSPVSPAFQGSASPAASIRHKCRTAKAALPIGRKMSSFCVFCAAKIRAFARKQKLEEPACRRLPLQSGVECQVYAFFAQQKFEPPRESRNLKSRPAGDWHLQSGVGCQSGSRNLQSMILNSKVIWPDYL